MSAARPRLDLQGARLRAAKACGVDPDDLANAREHPWGWSFEAHAKAGVERIFVDAERRLVVTADPSDRARIVTLEARGPLGVPPWSPPPKRTWWDALRALLEKND